MKFKIVLHPSDQGFAVNVPSLPGCWSQGVDDADALDNIADAIHEYLLSIEQTRPFGDIRQIRVAV